MYGSAPPSSGLFRPAPARQPRKFPALAFLAAALALLACVSLLEPKRRARHGAVAGTAVGGRAMTTTMAARPFYKPANVTDPPKFFEEMLEGHRANGYWVELMDITGNGLPDVLAFGITEGEVVWFENPYKDMPRSATRFTRPWKRRVIAVLDQPIGVDSAVGIAGGKYRDFVVGSAFGGGPYDINNDGGQVFFFQNPLNRGASLDDAWTQRYIGTAIGVHRLRIGHFSRRDRLQVMVVPVVGAHPPSGGDPYSPLSIMLFTAPHDAATAAQWDGEVVDSSLRVAHGMSKGAYGGPGSLDSILVSSMEGVVWVRYDAAARAWAKESITQGVPAGAPSFEAGARDTFSGCQTVEVGGIGADRMKYVVASGPFHGNVVLVWIKSGGTPNSLANATWTQHYVHTFDEMAPNVAGKGGLHHILPADLDGDGEDELLIGHKWKGTYYAKIGEIAKGIMQLTCLTQAPATRLAVGDIDGDGLADFASLGNTLKTPPYTPAQLAVYHNMFGKE